MTPERKTALIRAVAVAVCTAVAAWKGIDLDTDDVVAALTFALAVSQLVRRQGDAAPQN